MCLILWLLPEGKEKDLFAEMMLKYYTEAIIGSSKTEVEITTYNPDEEI